MARINNLSNFLTDVATAIKNKKGSETPIPAANFDTEITNLPSQGVYQHKTTTVTENGTVTILPDTGYDAIDQLDLTVNIPLQQKTYTFTQNTTTTITPEQGYAGFSQVGLEINVPSSQPNLQDKTVTITVNGQQTIVADSGYDGLSQVIANINVPSGGLTPLHIHRDRIPAQGINVTVQVNDTSDYGFVFDGTVYRNNNQGVQGSLAQSNFILTAEAECDVTFHITQSSEQCCDYGIIDNETYQNKQGDFEKIIHLQKGANSIIISYQKDGSVDGGTDTFSFSIEPPFTPEQPEIDEDVYVTQFASIASMQEDVVCPNNTYAITYVNGLTANVYRKQNGAWVFVGVSNNANLIHNNIKRGITIGEITGSYTERIPDGYIYNPTTGDLERSLNVNVFHENMTITDAKLIKTPANADKLVITYNSVDNVTLEYKHSGTQVVLEDTNEATISVRLDIAQVDINAALTTNELSHVIDIDFGYETLENVTYTNDSEYFLSYSIQNMKVEYSSQFHKLRVNLAGSLEANQDKIVNCNINTKINAIINGSYVELSNYNTYVGKGEEGTNYIIPLSIDNLVAENIIINKGDTVSINVYYDHKIFQRWMDINNNVPEILPNFAGHLSYTISQYRDGTKNNSNVEMLVNTGVEDIYKCTFTCDISDENTYVIKYIVNGNTIIPISPETLNLGFYGITLTAAEVITSPYSETLFENQTINVYNINNTKIGELTGCNGRINEFNNFILNANNLIWTDEQTHSYNMKFTIFETYQTIGNISFPLELGMQVPNVNITVSDIQVSGYREDIITDYDLSDKADNVVIDAEHNTATATYPIISVPGASIPIGEVAYPRLMLNNATLTITDDATFEACFIPSIYHELYETSTPAELRLFFDYEFKVYDSSGNYLSEVPTDFFREIDGTYYNASSNQMNVGDFIRGATLEYRYVDNRNLTLLDPTGYIARNESDGITYYLSYFTWQNYRRETPAYVYENGGLIRQSNTYYYSYAYDANSVSKNKRYYMTGASVVTDTSYYMKYQAGADNPEQSYYENCDRSAAYGYNENMEIVPLHLVHFEGVMPETHFLYFDMTYGVQTTNRDLWLDSNNRVYMDYGATDWILSEQE